MEYPQLYEKFLDDFKVTRAHKNGHHLVAPLPSLLDFAKLVPTEAGRLHLAKGLQLREELMANMDRDPLTYGFKLPCWKQVETDLSAGIREVLIEGGNRSGKTEFAAYYAVRDLVDHPGHVWGFGHTGEETSIRLQQSRINKYLPPEWRNMGKHGTNVYMTYKEATGYSNRTFILPNGSKGFFFNYSQLSQNASILEGYEFDGFWADELIPVAFEEAVRFRLVTRRGCLIETFTPVQGYSSTVAGWHAGARVLEYAPSPLLPGANVPGVPVGNMPSVLQCLNAQARVYFFFSQWNVYNPYDEIVSKLVGEPAAKIKIRAYGWADKPVGTAFPRFREEVHVLKRNPLHLWSGIGMVPPKPWEGEEALAA